MKGWLYIQAAYSGKGKYDADNKPFLDFQKDIVEGGGKGGGLRQGDHQYPANVIRGALAPLHADTSLRAISTRISPSSGSCWKAKRIS